MPIAMSGISAPPTVALFAASEATMPSSLPLPNRSGSGEARLAAAYAASEPMFAPMPGSTPMSVPMHDERSRFFTCARHSPKASHGESAQGVCSTSFSLPNKSVKILPTAKRPIKTGMSPKPAFRLGKPSVQRSSPVAGCTPDMAASTPRLPASNPPPRDSSPTPANNANASTTSEKYSNGPSRVAHSDIGSANSHSASHDTTPPTSDAPIPNPSARPGRPARAMG